MTSAVAENHASITTRQKGFPAANKKTQTIYMHTSHDSTHLRARCTSLLCQPTWCCHRIPYLLAHFIGVFCFCVHWYIDDLHALMQTIGNLVRIHPLFPFRPLPPFLSLNYSRSLSAVIWFTYWCHSPVRVSFKYMPPSNRFVKTQQRSHWNTCDSRLLADRLLRNDTDSWCRVREISVFTIMSITS